MPSKSPSPRAVSRSRRAADTRVTQGQARGVGGKFVAGGVGAVPSGMPSLDSFMGLAGASLARDTDWTAEGFLGDSGRGLSPIVDVLRGLGDETAGIRAREPRMLLDSEITAMLRDGISRRVASIKVIQALAPGHTIDFVGLAPEVAQRLTLEATEIFKRISAAEHIEKLGIMAEGYGKAMLASSWANDGGVADLIRPMRDIACDRVRWLSVWDRRDYRVRGLAPSTTTQYRQGSGSTWLDLYPWQPSLEYDRMYGGLAGRNSDPLQVQVHPTRYVQLCTMTGFSVFQECAVYIANLLAAANGSASLLQRSAALIMHMDDWETQSLAGGSTSRDKLQAQLSAMSNSNVLVCAAGEKPEFANLSTSGIEQGLYAIAYLLSAARGIPMTILLGSSPGAFVSGEAQIKQWHQELDTTRKWLEPALRFVWDLCIAEVTGGVTGKYSITWNPYETPAAEKQLATKAKALEIAITGIEKGLLSVDGALAGLSKTGALDFDFGSAFAVGRPEDGDEIKENVEVGKFAAVLTALTAFYGEGQIPASALQALVSAVIGPLSEVVGTLFQPKPVAPVVPVVTGAPGVLPVSTDETVSGGVNGGRMVGGGAEPQCPACR